MWAQNLVVLCRSVKRAEILCSGAVSSKTGEGLVILTHDQTNRF
jgi:hypothetical protein